MTLHTVAQHTFDLDRLPARCTVLDVGCRGFDFTSGIRQLRPAALIYALDPDPAIRQPEYPECAFLHVALVGDPLKRRSRYASFSTGDGNFLTDLFEYYDAQMLEVNCVHITELAHFLPPAHKQWDLVKLDCEGSEFQILERWPGPIADQISVEFHDYNQKLKYNESYYSSLFGNLSRFGYKVVQHELSVQGTGCGHWDSLLVLS